MTQHAPDLTGRTAADNLSEPAPRLLVIDDEITHRTIIGTVARTAGFTISEATCFDEAEKILRKEGFDCITLDLSLGRNYGIEVIRLLADIGCKTPVIVISGAGHAVAELVTNVGRMLQLNICEPIPKPIDFALLKGILARIEGNFCRCSGGSEMGFLFGRKHIRDLERGAASAPAIQPGQESEFNPADGFAFLTNLPGVVV
jgi:DNA-binding response OmpR family regulator